ncbi:MAG: hypothetical protein P0119_06485 [Nitrospira sp.]|nr:hypothetical protein [Nitrospira sp.]
MRPQRHVVVFLLALAGSLLWFGLTAEAKSDYDIINTGIKGGGCWYDDSHFVVIQGHQPAPGQGFVVEGLYYLDPNQPKDLRRIDLSPIEPTLQKQIRDVTCQEQTILFDIMAPDRKTSRLYRVKIGTQPKLVADMRWAKPAVISLKGQYVLGNKLTVDKGVWVEQADCDVKFLEPGLKALCWPRDTIPQWLTPQLVVNQYLWRETILVREQDGNVKRIPNPKPPLRLADGTELKQGYLLRDLENRIVHEISMKQDPYQVVDFHLDPRGIYLYGVCYKAGDHGDKHYTVGGRICRFRLDGQNQRWEEVVSVQQSPRDPFSLHALDVNAQGDVLMIERGHRSAIGLWMYDAQSKMVSKLLQVVSPEELQGFRISPNGRWISVTKESSQLILIKRKGVTP